MATVQGGNGVGVGPGTDDSSVSPVTAPTTAARSGGGRAAATGDTQDGWRRQVATSRCSVAPRPGTSASAVAGSWIADSAERSAAARPDAVVGSEGSDPTGTAWGTGVTAVGAGAAVAEAPAPVGAAAPVEVVAPVGVGGAVRQRGARASSSGR